MFWCGLMENNASVKNVKPATPAEKLLVCDKCNFSTAWRTNLRRHKRSVHQAGVFTCSQCDYSSTRRDTLNAHVRNAHEGQVLACEHCDFTAGLPQTLKRHIASKHELKRFLCNHCGFTATRREHLKTHELTSHHGQLFKCELCNFTAKWKPNLQRHMKSVHSSFELTCPACPCRNQLKLHQKREHSDLTDLQCDKCSYNMVSKQSPNRSPQNLSRFKAKTDTLVLNPVSAEVELLNDYYEYGDGCDGSSVDIHDLTGLEIHEPEDGNFIIISGKDLTFKVVQTE